MRSVWVAVTGGIGQPGSAHFHFFKENTMNLVESGTSSTAGLESSATTSSIATTGGTSTPASAGVTPTSSSVATSAASAPAPSASPVSQELQAAKQSTTTTSATAAQEQRALMTKVLDTLVSVVSAMVTLVTALVHQLKGSPVNGGAPSGTGSSSGSGATSGSNGSVGGTTGNQGTGNQGPGSGAVGQTPGTGSNTGAPIVRSALDVNKNDAGMISVRTLDGYTIRAEGRDEAWTITGPDGKTTRIWGDPHVTESDGDKWDFVNRSTFMFGKNKATIEVVPAGNGQTFSARLTVYSDYERVTIDGIEKNQPTIVAASTDGLQHDASLADGEIYKRVVTPSGESWVSVATGKTVPVRR